MSEPALPTILVVDDENHVRRSLRRVLRSDFDVVLAESGDAAVAMLDEGQVFDAVLLDLMMRGRTGIDVYNWVSEVLPQLAERFVFMSGGAVTDEARDFLMRHDDRVLYKPLDTAELRETVGAVAARSRGTPVV